MSIVSELQSLSPDESQLIYQSKKLRCPISVRQYQHYRWLQLGGDAIQSLVDLNNPDKVIVPVCQSMLLALLYVENPKNVLFLGSGGGSFERFFHIHYPTIEQVSVEKSQQVIDIAHKYFSYPSDVAVINDSADHFLASCSQNFDLIFCDIFDGEKHPACLSSKQFHQHLQKNLNVGGVVVFNFMTLDQQSVVEILQTIRQYFSSTALLAIPQHSNVVLFASRQPLIQTPKTKKIASLQTHLTHFDLCGALRQIRELPAKN